MKPGLSVENRCTNDSIQLFKIKFLPGSVTLPTEAGPNPQLKSIYMRVPTGMNRFMKFYMGARTFWRGELARLKFRNPGLDVRVETVSKPKINEPFYMTLEYHSSQSDTLTNLKTTPLPKPLERLPVGIWTGEKRGSRLTFPPKEGEQIIFNGVQTEPSDDPEAKIRFHNPSRLWREMGEQFLNDIGKMPKTKDIKPVEFSRMILEHCPKDEVVPVAQSAADASAPQTTSPPETIYSRKVTTPITGVRHIELWNWIRQTGRLPYIGSAPSEEELKEYHQSQKDDRRSNRDRKRVKKGLETKRGQEKALKDARAEAERITSEAA